MGGFAMVPLQQPRPQLPAQGGGQLGPGGAATEQSLVPPGAGGSQQLLRGLWGMRRKNQRCL